MAFLAEIKVPVDNLYTDINETRTKTENLLINIFKKKHEETPEFFINYEKYGSNIEKSIFNGTLKECKNKKIIISWDNPELREIYISTFRKIRANLTYTANSDILFERLKSKEYKPTDLAQMTHKELDPEGWTHVQKLVDDSFRREFVDDEKKEHRDGMFKCGRCKSMKTSHRQAQCRSADEPMSVFANCNNCGHKWKFS